LFSYFFSYCDPEQPNFKHPNIVSAIGFAEQKHAGYSNRSLCVVLEKIGDLDLYTSLNSDLDDTKALRCDWDTKLNVALQIANGIQYLHETRQVKHRDIKSKNVLLKLNKEPIINQQQQQQQQKATTTSQDYWEVKLCDFCECTDGDKFSSITPKWSAPELLASGNYNNNTGSKSNNNINKSTTTVPKYTFMCDIFSLAIVFHEIATCKEPERPCLNGWRPPIDGIMHEEFKRLIVSCWDENPMHRPTISDIVAAISQMQKARSNFHLMRKQIEVNCCYYFGLKAQVVNSEIAKQNFIAISHEKTPNAKSCIASLCLHVIYTEGKHLYDDCQNSSDYLLLARTQSYSKEQYDFLDKSRTFDPRISYILGLITFYHCNDPTSAAILFTESGSYAPALHMLAICELMKSDEEIRFNNNETRLKTVASLLLQCIHFKEPKEQQKNQQPIEQQQQQQQQSKSKVHTVKQKCYYPPSMYLLAQLYRKYAASAFQNVDYLEVFKLARLAAFHNQPDALFLLGELYEQGLTVNSLGPDKTTALYYFKQAEQRNCAQAAFRLVQVHGRGELGQQIDEKQSLEYLKRAAQLYHFKAIAELGKYYLHTMRDKQACLSLLERSALVDRDVYNLLAQYYIREKKNFTYIVWCLNKAGQKEKATSIAEQYQVQIEQEKNAGNGGGMCSVM